MKRHPDPVGPENDLMLHVVAREAAGVVCAWGNHGGHLDRAKVAEALLRATGKTLLRMPLTKKGQPGHPLMLAYEIKLTLWGTNHG